MFCVVFLFSGCATAPRPASTVKQPESVSQQIEAARKVVKGMVAASSDAAPVIKYSPTTGKHYSGNLEFDPETGEKLEVLPEN